MAYFVCMGLSELFEYRSAGDLASIQLDMNNLPRGKQGMRNPDAGIVRDHGWGSLNSVCMI